MGDLVIEVQILALLYTAGMRTVTAGEGLASQSRREGLRSICRSIGEFLSSKQPVTLGCACFIMQEKGGIFRLSDCDCEEPCFYEDYQVP